MTGPSPADTTARDEEDYHFFYNPFHKAIVVGEAHVGDSPLQLFLTKPFYAPLLFPNESSDARDHAANERTYLSYLRLSVYLAIVSVAIVINFHLKHQPTPIEERISRPLGIIFWLLALACLVAGFANYIKTVAKYARKAALVQSGLKTQMIFGVVSCAIIAACAVFLASEAQRSNLEQGTKVQVDRIDQTDIPSLPSPMENDVLMLLANLAGSGLI